MKKLLLLGLLLAMMFASQPVLTVNSQSPNFAIRALGCGNVRGAFKTSGTADIFVAGGGIHADSNAAGSGASAAAAIGGSVTLTLTDSVLTTPGSVSLSGGSSIVPVASGFDAQLCDPSDPNAITLTDPLNALAPPADPSPSNPCSSPAIGAATTLSPGKYCSIVVMNGDNLTLTQGVYWLDGGDFRSVGSGSVIGNGVTIYMAGGDVNLNGGLVQLAAPTSGPWQGLLLFMERANPPTAPGSNNGNGGTVSLASSGALDVTGTIYGRDSDMALGGPGGGLIKSIILAYTVELGGAGVLSVNAALPGQTITADIDIKPGSNANPINLKSKGTLPVAILSTTTFDAPSQVDAMTLTFGHTGDEDSLQRRGRNEVPNCAAEDVNSDGLPDLVCHFTIQETGLQAADSEGILRGQTMDSQPIEGSDALSVVP